MRIIPTLLKTSYLAAIIGAASTATADEIGKYTLTINDHQTNYVSEYIADTGAGKSYSDLAKISSNNTDMIRVDAHIPPTVNPQSTQPSA